MIYACFINILGNVFLNLIDNLGTRKDRGVTSHGRRRTVSPFFLFPICILLFSQITADLTTCVSVYCILDVEFVVYIQSKQV